MRVRHLLSLVLVASVVAACSEAPVSPPDTDEAPLAARSPGGAGAQAADGYVPGRVLARFAPGADRAAIAAPHGASPERELRLQGIWILRVPQGREETVAEALSRNPNVRFAEVDHIRTFGLPCESTDGDCTAPDDTYFRYQWDHHNDGTIEATQDGDVSTGRTDADIDWLEAFDQLGAFSGGARIGIIDTGIHDAHGDLSGKVVADHDFIRGDGDADPEHYHGTHVAGIAAALSDNGLGVGGVAWGSNVKLLDAKVCDDSGCPTSAIVDAIVWATDNGAHVLNLSLGGRFGSNSEQQALQYARSAGVLPFCASGNDGSGRISYPAAFEECVAVGATDWSDGRASYSNAGKELELSAPGGDGESAPYSYVLSTYYDPADGFVGYAWAAGTSMATPQAAGLAALLHATGTVTGADAILDRMRATADDLGSAGWDRDFGHGRINAFAALNGATDGGGGGGGGDDGGGDDGECIPRGNSGKCR